MKTKLFWHTVRYAAFCRPDTLHCSYEEFCETWPQLAAGGLYPKFGHYCLMPLAAEGHIFGGCEFIRYDDRPWSEKEFQSSANISPK